MDKDWGSLYSVNVLCQSPRKKLEPLEKFAEKYQQKCSKGILNKLHELVGDPITKDSTPWIDRLLYQFFDDIGDRGFKVKDLPKIAEVLEFLSWKTREVPEYKPHLTKMLEVIARPPELEKTSEILTCSKILQDYFSELGSLILLLPTHAEILNILGSLHELLTRPKKAEVSAIKLEYLHKGAENSDLPVILARLSPICPPEIWRNLLEVVCDIVTISKTCCRKMLNEDILSFLLPQLDLSYQKFVKKRTKDALIVTTRCVWMLMRSAQPDESDETSPSGLQNCCPNYEDTLSLKNLFMTIVDEASSESHMKKIRNDLAMIILAGLVGMPSWNILSCGLAKDIIILLKCSKMPATKEDLFFLKTLLAIVCHFRTSHFCISIMKENEMISGILKLLCIDEESRIPKRSPYCVHLAKYVLRTVATLVPELSETFIKFQGPAKLLIMLEWSITMESDQTVALEAVKAVSLIISSQNEDLTDQFKAAGAVNVLFKLINRLVILNELNHHNQTLLTLLLTTLESLQKDNPCQLNQGLKVILKLLHRFSDEPGNDFQIKDKLVISAVSYTWTCIVHNPSALGELIERGGVYLVLDSLEQSSLLSQNLFLGMLSDMLITSNCITYLCTWRGRDKSKGFLSLLAKIWRDEEHKMAVKRTQNGCLGDIDLPLMGEVQWENTFSIRLIENYSPTLESLLGSVRPKIYSIRKQLLGKSEALEMIQEHFKMVMDDLPVEDSITFCIIDQFFRFTRGQVWGEVLGYLKDKGVDPLGVDKEMLEVMCQRHRECGSYVRDCQEKILEEEKDKERRREVEDIQRIRDARLGSALEAARTIDLIRRTADKGYRMKKRAEQKSKVDRALNFPEDANPRDCHRTYPERWNVTTIFDQHHRIKVIPSEEVRRVSSAQSETISYNYSEDWDY